MSEVFVKNLSASATIAGTRVRVMRLSVRESAGSPTLVSVTGVPDLPGIVANSASNDLVAAVVSDYVADLQKTIYQKVRSEPDCALSIKLDDDTVTHNGILTNVGSTSVFGQVASTYTFVHPSAALASFNGAIYSGIFLEAFRNQAASLQSTYGPKLTGLQGMLDLAFELVQDERMTQQLGQQYAQSDVTVRASILSIHAKNVSLIPLFKKLVVFGGLQPFPGFAQLGPVDRLEQFRLFWMAFCTTSSGLDMIFGSGMLLQPYGLTAHCEGDGLVFVHVDDMVVSKKTLSLAVENLDFSCGADNGVPIRRVCMEVTGKRDAGNTADNIPKTTPVLITYPNGEAQTEPATVNIPVPQWLRVSNKILPITPEKSKRLKTTPSALKGVYEGDLRSREDYSTIVEKACLAWCRTMYIKLALRGATSNLNVPLQLRPPVGYGVTVSVRRASQHLMTAWLAGANTEISLSPSGGGSARTSLSFTHVQARGFKLA